jgi:hypothetical protein
MVKYRLQVTEPELLNVLRSQSSERLRKIAIEVCRFALERSELSSPLVDEAMGFLKRGYPVPARVKTDLRDFVDRLDRQYFDLKEAAEAADNGDEMWHPTFHKARAAAAVLFACEEDPLFAAAEAADEARVAAHDDTSGLRQVITGAPHRAPWQ